MIWVSKLFCIGIYKISLPGVMSDLNDFIMQDWYGYVNWNR